MYANDPERLQVGWGRASAPRGTVAAADAPPTPIPTLPLLCCAVLRTYALRLGAVRRAPPICCPCLESESCCAASASNAFGSQLHLAPQVETARVYQTAGVNPLAGCLPSLATIPVFIGLYR